MSVRLMADVFEHSEARGTDRMVLLAIADEADDDGRGGYPGYDLLARKCRMPRTTVRRAVERLESLGELRVFRPEQKGRGHYTTYAVTLAQKRANLAPSEPEKRAETGHKGPERAARPPLTSVDGQYAVPKTHISSSSAPEPAMNPEEEDPVTTTARLIAGSRLRNRKGDPIGNPDAWLERVTKQVRARHEPYIRAMLGAGKSPETAATTLEPDPLPTVERRPCCNTTLGGDHMFTCPEHPRNQEESA